MKKIAKYIVGCILLFLFFFAIDPSGVGFKTYIKKVKDWADGKTKILKFETADIKKK